ncbi:MAG: PEP-CTERM sorting domain-containing protein, partial [Rhizobacter sp.]|nr:PEP-CTERM sorting domain-containing protein [Rhizobacter sp.]
RLNVEAGNLVLGSGITVRGDTGIIGNQSFVGGAASLTNNGTIQADVAGGKITIGVSGPVVNNGTLAALNGGTLWLNSSINNSVGSQILAGTGSSVVQNGVTLNGNINVIGSGSFSATNNGNNFLEGAKLAGTLDLASNYGVERVVNGLTLNGTVNIGGGSIFAPQGDQTIGGSGNIVFTDTNGSNRLNVEAGNLVLGSGITVRGDTGIIGNQNYVGGAASLTNNGTIQADVAGGKITIGVSGPVVNNGTLAALNGGTLWLNSSINNAVGSQILAGTGSSVVQNGVTLNGNINVVGSGSFSATNNGNNFLDGAKFAGTLDLASAYGVERVKNGLTLNGTVNIGGGSIFAPQGDQTIGGSGNIVFADNNGSNRLNVEAGNLVLGSGVTVRGVSGIIGNQSFVGGAAALTNNGVINADGGGTISVGVSGTTTNNGLMRAQNGTLSVNSPLVNNGTLRADAAGVVNLPTNFANDGLMTGVGNFALSGTLTNNGHVAPGTPGGEPGALTLDGKYAQGAGGWFDVGLDGPNFGSLSVSGSASLDGTIGVICQGACDYSAGTSWVVMMTGGSNLVTGAFFGPVVMTGFSAGAFSVTYLSNEVLLNVTADTVGAVPEPSTYAMLLAGLAAVGFVVRRRRTVCVGDMP